MEKIQDDHNDIYILNSKKKIDEYINKHDYKKTFLLLIIVIERLNNNEKKEFIEYYSKKINNLFIGISNLDDRFSYN
jgi:hypothetical protein